MSISYHRTAQFPTLQWSAGLAALLAVALSLPVGLLAVRHPGRLARVISRLCQVGYAVPEVVVALSLVLLINRAQGLSRSFAIGEKPAVDRVSFTLPEGEILALVGENSI